MDIENVIFSYIFSALRAARAEVLKTLEGMREAKTIGSSLQAEVELRASGDTLAQLQSLGGDLRFVMITSQAKVSATAAATATTDAASDTLEITATASIHAKCERCWHYREEVGAHAEHPTLCGRCVSNLFGAGEPRQFA